jgi:hypothetical protein
MPAVEELKQQNGDENKEQKGRSPTNWMQVPAAGRRRLLVYKFISPALLN